MTDQPEPFILDTGLDHIPMEPILEEDDIVQI